MPDSAHASNEPTLQQLFDLTGKVSLITGASGHLGSSLARALAEAGSRVVVTSRDAQRAEQAARALPDPAGVGHVGVVLDHMDEASIEEGFAEVVRQVGHVDVLVNNGNEACGSDWTTVTGDEFNRQLANVTGYFVLSRLVRNLAVERKAAASIVMLGSMYGLVASYPDAYADVCAASPAGYHALKGGVIHLTRHLAVYWAEDRIRVNCLSPGPFPSEAAPGEMVERLIQRSPMKRMGQPHELKGALLLLTSGAGSYLTGQNIVVDGGWTAW